MDNVPMITTTDNPYSPFTEFENWLSYDMQMGFKTCERVASVALTSDELTDEENREATLEAFRKLIHTGAISKEGKLYEYKIVWKFPKNEQEQ